MCELFISQFKDDPEPFNKIIWSDKKSSKLNNMINQHNCVIFATVYEKQLNQPGITVWGALSSDGLLSPYFFNETVTKDNYFEMLNEYVSSQLQDRPDFNNLLFMQDGALPHYTKKVCDLLDILLVGWIGYRECIDWASHSCDLISMDFNVWRMMKNKKPRTLSQPQHSIKSMSSNKGHSIIFQQILRYPNTMTS